MIEVTCKCATPRQAPEAMVGKKVRCNHCGQVVQIVSAEPIGEGGGSADFDASLLILEGPGQGQRVLLGGVADIEIGKLPDRHIVLNAERVSRQHCKLVRIDFGPSRWSIVDNRSTNGVLVNGERVSEHDLQNGDEIRIGDVRLQYCAPQADLLPEPTAAQEQPLALKERPAAATPAPVGAVMCPSCDRGLHANAKICTQCGINIHTGRPLLISQGVDLNVLYGNAKQVIRLVSILIPLTPLPMPIRSEAFGEKKPYSIWGIAILTVLASLAFFIYQQSGPIGPDGHRPGDALLLWSPYAHGIEGLRDADLQKLHQMTQEKMTDRVRSDLRRKYDPEGQLSDDDLLTAAVEDQLHLPMVMEFHPYQLITHAFLHDTSSIWAFALHLGGNMLFLLVFGTRVNALIGNIATLLVYPIVAIFAAWSHILFGAAPNVPMLGASGAIMGLAGMYLILFPLHRVYCAMWLRLRFYLVWKIFPLRGFWILLIYFGYDIAMNILAHYLGGSGGGVAHWAHIGGFTTGMALGGAVLLSKMFNTNGGDLLSVTLGKKAWPLIGKPSRWIRPTSPGLMNPAMAARAYS